MSVRKFPKVSKTKKGVPKKKKKSDSEGKMKIQKILEDKYER